MASKENPTYQSRLSEYDAQEVRHGRLIDVSLVFLIIVGLGLIFVLVVCRMVFLNQSQGDTTTAFHAVPHLIFDISFHGWPPYVAAGEFLASYDTWMSLMYLLQDWKLQFWWHHHSHSKHQAPFVDRQLTASVKVWFQLFVFNIRRPSFSGEVQNKAEKRITSCVARDFFACHRKRR
ncbi:hypothetical protein MTO96_003877 [Rhipicephalus appendiculatus]